MTEPLYETIEQLSTPKYAPRFKPTPIPSARWDEEPLYCLKVNDQWISHILGVLTALDQPDTWVGTSEQISDARQQVNQIMVAFMEQCDDMSNCCPEPNRTRYTIDGHYEISYDGGTTWQSGDDFDPRVTSPTLPPIPGDDGNAKKCDAANSVLVQIKDKVETWQGYLSTAGTLVEFATAAVGLLAVLLFAPAAVPFLLGVCLTLLKTLWDAGEEEYALAFTDSVYNDLLCILYCHARSDGTYDDAAISAILSDCASHFDPIARDAFSAAFKGWGAVGTTNAATIGGGGLDCDDCGPCSDACAQQWVEKLDEGYFYGHITEQTDEYVIITCDVPNINGSYYGNIWTNSTTLGCYTTEANIEILSGSGVGYSWRDNPGSGGLVSGIFGGRCINWIQPQSAAPFVIKITFADCP